MPVIMRATHASPLISFGIAILSLAVAIWFVWATGAADRFFGVDRPRRLRRTAVAVAVLCMWLLLPAFLASSGWLRNFNSVPPPLLILVPCCVSAALAIGLSRCGWQLAHGLSLSSLVGIHGFRFPLELVMHQAAVEQVMPLQMSFSGSNFDIVSGISAIALAALIQSDKAPRALLWLWNAAGIALLIMIMSIAVRSLPMFHAYGTEPQQLNTWIADFPFVWLPAFLVPAAVLGHVLVTRRLLDR
jgi:hypothetical protein